MTSADAPVAGERSVPGRRRGRASVVSLVTRPAARAARRREAFAAYLFLAPALLGLIALFGYPLVGTFWLSFTATRPFVGSEWIGTANYAQLFTDPKVARAIGNSFIYMLITLLGVPIATVVAAMIHQVSRGKNIYRVLYFLPVVTLPVAVGMVWRFIYNGDFGLLNHLLGLVGIEGQYWVADPKYTIYSISVVGIWMGLGTSIIILGAGLAAIPVELYEASALDGAGRARQFFSITLPLLSPSIFFVTILSVINGLQVFDLVFIMLRGPSNTALVGSQTIVYLFYQSAFVELNRGYGAAIAMVLLVIIMVATAIQFRLQRAWVFYGQG